MVESHNGGLGGTAVAIVKLKPALTVALPDPRGRQHIRLTSILSYISPTQHFPLLVAPAAAAKKLIEVQPETRTEAIEGDRVDARVGIRQTEAHDLIKGGGKNKTFILRTHREIKGEDERTRTLSPCQKVLYV